MAIEIKEIKVVSTVVDNRRQNGVSPEIIKKIKRDIMSEVKLIIDKKDKKRRSR